MIPLQRGRTGRRRARARLLQGQDTEQMGDGLAEEQRALDDIAQLAAVAGPVVAQELLQIPGAELRVGDTQFGGQDVEEIAREERDVAPALAQGRQAQIDDIDPVIEILAEMSGEHLGGQIAVGRGDHPCVDRNLLVAADRAVTPLLQHAQQLRLQGKRHLADLVEKEGAVIGMAEKPIAGLMRAGEGAAQVSERMSTTMKSK